LGLLAQRSNRARFNVAVGATNEVQGEVWIDRADLRQSRIGTITVNISTFKSDQDGRDSAIRTRWLESGRFASGNIGDRRTWDEAILVSKSLFKDYPRCRRPRVPVPSMVQQGNSDWPTSKPMWLGVSAKVVAQASLAARHHHAVIPGEQRLEDRREHVQ